VNEAVEVDRDIAYLLSRDPSELTQEDWDRLDRTFATVKTFLGIEEAG
jgi:hypothetical protein